MNTWMQKCALAGALTLGVQLPAQVAANTPTTPATATAVAASAKAMGDGMQLRGDMAGTVASGSEKPGAAIARLKANASPSGLKIDHDADFAFAAIDVGKRLIAAGKATEAEQFFLEAEKSLSLVVGKTPDTSAQDKAMFLEKLAWIRRRYPSGTMKFSQ
ncbi:MAG: hypothetical protein KGL39_60470 [Patescibacteria group bacterium]|nr:hypothetical protein [Patescibacteria group bacterium]